MASIASINWQDFTAVLQFIPKSCVSANWLLRLLKNPVRFVPSEHLISPAYSSSFTGGELAVTALGKRHVSRLQRTSSILLRSAK